MRKRYFGLLALCFGTALAGLGCSSSADDAAPPASGPETSADEVQVFSWWVAPGEADALQALINSYRGKYPSGRVVQFTKTSSVDWTTILGQDIDKGKWDVVQSSAAGLADFMTAHTGSLQPVDDIYAEPTLAASVIPIIAKAAAVNGHAMGVVTGVHRNNAFHYNKQIFSAQKLNPPTTIAEFLDVCAKLKAVGVTPVATTFDTWVLRFMLLDLAMGTLGATPYESFIRGTTPATDPDLTAGLTSAVDTWVTVITDYVDVTAAKATGYDWAKATQSLYDNKAAMFFMGDWVKGLLVKLGWTPGVDFGVSGPPGANDLFVYGADAFALPTSAPHLTNARNFLAVVASAEGQVAFNRQKGSTPMRTDVRALLDDPGKLSLDDLQNAKVRVPGHDSAKWDTAIETFLTDGNKAALVQALLDSRPTL
jgi:glucose/mannose transport system substrate-binding protein